MIYFHQKKVIYLIHFCKYSILCCEENRISLFNSFKYTIGIIIDEI